MSVEQSTSQLAAKKGRGIQSRANEFLKKRFQKRSGASGEPSSRLSSFDDSLHQITHNRSNGNQIKSKSNIVRVGSSDNALHNIQALQEANESIEALRGELDRVKAGITLLTQSIEKLNELVQAESSAGCCSTLLDLVSYGKNSPAVSINPKSSGYNRVDYRDEDHSASLLSPHPSGAAPQLMPSRQTFSIQDEDDDN